MDSGGPKIIRVKGTPESSITEETVYNEEIYNFNVVRIDGDLELSAELGANGKVKINEVETDISTITDLEVSEDGKIYSVGNQADVATASTYAKNGVVLKVEGDLKIGEDVTLTSVKSTGNYGGPKGMYIYCAGTLTNNGIISMTARGAKADGQDVYLFKNLDKTYEHIPKVGASGGVGVTNASGRIGNSGESFKRRALGGGGSGGCGNSNSRSGAGGNATSYSGGSGGGAAQGSSQTWPNGGARKFYWRTSEEVEEFMEIFILMLDGGAGNPGAAAHFGVGHGTGGLLVLIINSDSIPGEVTACGIGGGKGQYASGGASGGGSVNVFFLGSPLTILNADSFSALGGPAVPRNFGGTANAGGAGGPGSVTVGSIVSNYYTDLNI